LKRGGGFVQRQHSPGAVDLAYSATLPEWQFQAARICDVAKTINIAVTDLAEAIAQHLAKQRKTTDAQTAALEKRVTTAESEHAVLVAENASLKRDLVELRAEIGDLADQIKRDRATRGVGDGASLPASLVRKNRAAAKASR
jgi:septal ring factor EnvC (AmiA/AmiB activator)